MIAYSTSSPSPFPTPLLPSPSVPTSSYSPSHYSYSLTLPPPTSLLNHPTPFPSPLLPILFSLHWFVNHWGWVVCCMGHWCDMHLHVSLQDGNTPLIEASGWGHVGCVQLLLDRGAQIDHQNEVSAFRN